MSPENWSTLDTISRTSNSYLEIFGLSTLAQDNTAASDFIRKLSSICLDSNRKAWMDLSAKPNSMMNEIEDKKYRNKPLSCNSFLVSTMNFDIWSLFEGLTDVSSLISSIAQKALVLSWTPKYLIEN
ncbi:hypothetical protein OGAPHI_003117 [Ogataea philodendri]|uniref:Uncharacterized protein n=1 Tax=Ogataea philodendri TaxID=1378263 RepID=A0A9P8P8E5_9ASCO|nr:uncharacterized protein OGAPHI_003117 [Ogataea philodendri]KAH3667468.1 hypothetical protein OGAPHI_003117 [Ogataea philodendri]